MPFQKVHLQRALTTILFPESHFRSTDEENIGECLWTMEHHHEAVVVIVEFVKAWIRKETWLDRPLDCWLDFATYFTLSGLSPPSASGQALGAASGPCARPIRGCWTNQRPTLELLTNQRPWQRLEALSSSTRCPWGLSTRWTWWWQADSADWVSDSGCYTGTASRL